MKDISDQAPDKIVRRKISDEVFDRLLLLIEEGEYEPGDRLPSERELMVRFGVGRAAIREALQTLESHGLIAITHGDGARLTRPSPFDVISQIEHVAHRLLATSPGSLEHLKEARELFELGMVREAAARATDQDIARLAAALEAQAATLGQDPGAFVVADMAFHTTIASVTKNPIFESGSAAMLHWLSRFNEGVLRWKGKERQTLIEHREILDAITDHDQERAAEAMLAHLRRTRSIYRTRIKPRGQALHRRRDANEYP